MIIGVDKKSLQKQRDQKYKEYAILLNSHNPSNDELNALKSEIKYLDDKLKKINGLEAVRNHPNIHNILQFKYEGDELNARGTLNQVFARIYMIGENEADLKDTIAFVKKK